MKNSYLSNKFLLTIVTLTLLQSPINAISGYDLKTAISEGFGDGLAYGLSKGLPGAIRESFKEFKDQFSKSGDGNQGLSNLFQSWSNHFSEGGEGRLATQNTGQAFGDMIRTAGHGFTSVFATNAAIAVAATFGIAGAWFGTKAFLNYLDRYLQKPKIIIRSSHKGFFARLSNAFGKKPLPTISMIFNEELQKRLDSIILAANHTSTQIKAGKKNIKYRNLMLYGAPGTGKTMFAEKLAQESGMEFVVVSGASFSKKGAIEAMDELFAWANKSTTGLVIFIDEAESLMINRDDLDPDSQSYKVYTNFLNYTGTRSDKFMIVMATNRLQIIDEAMNRRIDDLVEFKAPEFSERTATLKLYASKYLFDKAQNDALFTEQSQQLFTDEQIERVAQATAGFSNGDLEGLINTIKSDSNCTIDGLITQAIIDNALANMIQKQQAFNKV